MQFSACDLESEATSHSPAAHPTCHAMPPGRGEPLDVQLRRLAQEALEGTAAGGGFRPCAHAGSDCQAGLGWYVGYLPLVTKSIQDCRNASVLESTRNQLDFML